MRIINALPLVSILMTAYNKENLILPSIRSVLESSYSNFELIIVDDYSVDNTFEVVANFANSDSRIKVFQNNENIGDYPNRNRAASYAIGKYLKYVDSDDLIYPHGLEIMVKTMERFPEAGFGLCSIPRDIDRMFPFQLSPKDAYEYNFFKQSIFNSHTLSAIISKTVFEKVGGFPEKKVLGDSELWHLLALAYPVVLMQQGLVWHRQYHPPAIKRFRESEITHNGIAMKYLQDSRCLMSDMLRDKAMNFLLKGY